MSKYINLIKNIGLFAISNVAIKFIVFFLTPLYTYYLSTGQFGITDMLNTVIALILPVATMSIPDAVLRFCVDDSCNAKKYITIGFLITAISNVIVLCFLPILNLSIFGGLGNYKWWFLASYAAVCFQTLGSNVARGLNQIKLMSWCSIASAAVNCVLSLILIAVLHCSIVGFFVSFISGNAVGAVCYLVFGRHYRFIQRYDHEFVIILRHMLMYCIPLIPNALFWWMNQSINRFFLTGILGIGASGIFAAASKIPGILNLVTGVFQQAWSLSAFQEYQHDGTEKFFNNIYEIYNDCIAICAGILIALSQWIASFLFQKEFYSAWIFVPVLLVAFYYNSLSSFYGSIFTASMKTHYLFTTTMVGAFICLVTTYPLVRFLGIQGAGVAAALSTLAVLLLRAYSSSAFLKINHDRCDLAVTHSMILVSCIAIVIDSGVSVTVGTICCVCLVMYKTIRLARRMRRLFRLAK